MMSFLLEDAASSVASSSKEGLWKINNFGDACLLALLCIAMVFVVLIIITLLMGLLNRIKALDVKETVTMKDGTVLDEDAMAAVLVASIDFRKETKEDFKVVSCELIETEKKKK